MAIMAIVAGCTPRGTVPQGWSSPTVSGNRVYVGTRDGRLIGVSIPDGRLVMNASLQQGAAIYGSPLVSDNAVFVGAYIGTTGRVYSFVTDDNQSDRDFPPSGRTIGQVVGSLAAAGGNIYFGTADRRVYAVNERLQEQWVFPPPTDRIGKVWSTPTVSNGVVYIGSFDHKLYALDAATGTLKWQKPFATDGAIMATPVVVSDTVYIGSFDRKLYALNTADGTPRWSEPYEAESWFWASPVVSGDVVYAVSINGWLHVLAANTGRLVTKLKLSGAVSAPPVLAGNLLVMVTEAGDVQTVDVSPQLSHLEVKTLTNIGEKVYAAMGIDNTHDTIYVHTQADNLYSISLTSGIKTELPTK